PTTRSPTPCAAWAPSGADRPGRCSRRCRSSEADPLRLAVGELLLLPDRHLGLDPLDQQGARLERLLAVPGGRRRHERDVTDLQVPVPVHRGEIGRASCRERVETPGAAVPLQRTEEAYARTARGGVEWGVDNVRERAR